MPSPLIGVTTSTLTSSRGEPQLSLHNAYTHAICQAGGIPAPISNHLSPAILDDLFGRLSGLLFSGGGDINPSRYGSLPHPLVSEVDPARDATELHLLNRAVESDLPFLGICRGLQLVNVGLGGTLFEDVPSQYGAQIPHNCTEGFPLDHPAHTVSIEGSTSLALILGQATLNVNSHHHQAIRRLAPGLVASACSPDGIIEAIELPGRGFALAVQWHPEHLLSHPGMATLFSKLVAAAGA